MSSVQRTTKLLKLKPYKIPVVHALHQPDPNKRLRFCNWVLEKVNSGDLDAKEIFFSDEAWFYLHGQVCSQNYRYYSDWKTERVSASSCSLTPCEAAGRPGMAASDSHLLLRLIYEWLCRCNRRWIFFITNLSKQEANNQTWIEERKETIITRLR